MMVEGSLGSGSLQVNDQTYSNSCETQQVELKVVHPPCHPAFPSFPLGLLPYELQTLVLRSLDARNLAKCAASSKGGRLPLWPFQH